MLQEVHAPSFAEIFRRCLEGEGSWGRMPLESGEPLQEQRIVD
jgi:hypothetical protein